MLNKLLNVALEKKYAIAFWSLPAAVVLSAGGGFLYCLFLYLFLEKMKGNWNSRSHVTRKLLSHWLMKLSNSCLVNLSDFLPWWLTVCGRWKRKSSVERFFTETLGDKSCLSACLCLCVRLLSLSVTWDDRVWLRKVYYCESHFVENANETVGRSVLSNKYLLNIISNSFCLPTTDWIRPKC